MLSYALVLVPALWIVWSMFGGRRKPELSTKTLKTTH
jgi:hypothetical protein